MNKRTIKEDIERIFDYKGYIHSHNYDCKIIKMQYRMMNFVLFMFQPKGSEKYYKNVI